VVSESGVASAHFLTSGLGGSAAILELAGFLIPATQVLGFVASGIETLIESFLEVRKRPVDVPLHHGRSGKALRIAELLEGPAALLVPGVLGRFSQVAMQQPFAFCSDPC
jgi:hypothetical protein